MHRVVSLFDLIQIEKSREAFINNDMTLWYEILHELGFDINRDILEQKCLHRPLSTNEPFFGIRWIGTERKDEEWLSSPYCTRENKLEVIGIKDLEFQKDLLDMSRYPQWTQRAMEHMKDVGLEAFTVRYDNKSLYME